ncbi:GNAT family N-acetyltransferase [Nocardia sp. CA-084685]|uniref:GNAT family N-acetyltransferase n=1 Tax=Nocardia sp. CA-084685 TaxID=3239970 RepID=UPI003D98985F
MTLIPGITIRSATDDDVADIQLLGDTAFGMRSEPGYAQLRAQVFPTEEAIVAIDGGRVVGHARSTRMTLTVPGERAAEACGIAGVAVAPTHRRRGILRAIYTEQHRRTEAAGLPLTIFTASQGAIYGRFGYGPTIRQNAVSIDRRFVEFLPSAPDPGGVVLSTMGDAGEAVRAIYDRWRRLVPGAQARPEARWQMDLADSPAFRDGGTELFAFLHPDGYVLYRYHRREQGKTAVVEEMRAVTSEAQIALWRALFGLELCSHVEAAITDNDPLPYLLTDHRLVRTKARFDDLWLRLMDVPAALTARSYLRDLDVVLAVQDPFRHAGGTFALTVRDGIAECTPTTRPPDFELGIDVLASLYLGAYPARVFAAANRLQAKDTGQLRDLDEAFGAQRDAVLGWFF